MPAIQNVRIGGKLYPVTSVVSGEGKVTLTVDYPGEEKPTKAEIGNVLGCRIGEIFGLNNDRVMGLTLSADPAQVCQLNVTLLATPDQSEEVAEVLESYALVPKDEAERLQAVAAGMAWADIAKSAYRAYAASTGNKNFRGDPMPEFDDLPQPIKVAWQAAVRQVGNCIEYHEPGDEQAWAGWLPPQ